MKQNSRLYNARGMTLIEVMIAVGIMSIVSLTLSSLMSYLMRSQGGIKNSSDVQNIVNELQSITSVNSRLCKNALIPETGTDVISDENSGQIISLRGISYPFSSNTPDQYGNTIFEQNRSSFLIETGQPLKNNANLKVSKIYLINEEMLTPTSIKDPANPTKTIQLRIWRSKIKILFEKVNPTKGSAGPKNLFREISLDTAYYANSSGADAGKIQSCSSGAPDQTCKDYFAGESMILNADVPPKCRIPMIVSNSMFKLKVKKLGSDNSTPDYYTGLTLNQDTKIGLGTTDPQAQLHVAARDPEKLIIEHSQTTDSDKDNRVDNISVKTSDSSDFRSPSNMTNNTLLVDSYDEGKILVRGNGTTNYSSLCLADDPAGTDNKGWCMAYDIKSGLSFKAFSSVASDPAFYIHKDNRINFGSNNNKNFTQTTLLIDNSSISSGHSGIASLSFRDNYLALNSLTSDSCLYLGNSMTTFSGDQNWSLCRKYGTGPGELNLYNTSGATSFNIFQDGKVKFKTNGTGIDLTIAGSSPEKNFSFVDGKITADNQELKNGLIINSSNSTIVKIDNTKINAPELILNIKTINASGKTTITNDLDLTGNLNFTNGSINNVTNISANGSITVTGTVTASSDINLKKNIEIIPNSLERILKVKGVLFDWIDPQKDSRRQMGLIAQNVEKVFPELVYTNDHGIKSIAYQNLVAPLIEAVKSLWQMVQDLKQEVLQLKQELLALKTQQQNWNQKINQQESELKQIKMALCQSQPKLQMCYGFR
jgi:prepilin-type N-terminal cleavage/methylation domain-containing protein